MPPEYSVPEGVRRARADKVLAAAFPEHSRSAWARAFDAGLVTRAGQPLERSAPVSAGDVVTYAFPETKPAELAPAAIPLAVLFEDEHLLAIDKPAGMVVHPGAGTGDNTLVHALLAHCRGQLSGIGGVERPGIVHRLDRDTTGVILVAKTDPVHRRLAEAFAARTVVKEYLALCQGVPRERRGECRGAIARHPTQRHRMAVVRSGGRAAQTDWTVQRVLPPHAALVRCRIHTGRTHQVRVHLAAAGHPLLGDTVYGFKPARVPVDVPRVMLHAAHLVVTHPVTGNTLDLTAPLPEDFAALAAALEQA
jgi:23S rRNA pseudouridine1911/1915/1917 synthase